MKIHLVDVEKIKKEPNIGSIVFTNCGLKLEFRNGLKICENCLIVHNSSLKGVKGVSEINTFALKNEKEEMRNE